MQSAGISLKGIGAQMYFPAIFSCVMYRKLFHYIFRLPDKLLHDV